MKKAKILKVEPKASVLSRRAVLQGMTLAAGSTAAGILAPPITQAQSSTPAAARSGDVMVIASPKKNIVETSNGKISGFSRNGIQTFKGIPYGASTAGANRFMPPQKPAPWTGVRSALYWGPVSPQAYTSTFDGRRIGWNHDDEAFMFEWDDGQPSEDCLRVNVWTPATDNAKRPVMVWIHGGGFSSGSDNELRMYDGENLSRHGNVVVVSLNHRLGVLGYLNLSEYREKWASASNVGMLDIVAALEWVKENISNFGGDPNRVLIFGQSGGGGKVSTLMGMPSAEGLFHRAVVESGSMVGAPGHDRSGEVAAAVIAELGLTKDTIDKIQDLPNETVVEAGLRGPRKLQTGPPPAPGTGGGGLGWAPVVDGRILPRSPWYPDAPSHSAKVPLLVGTVLNEFTNSVQMGDASLDSMSLDEVKKRLSLQYKDRTDHILEVFQKEHPKATPFELLSRINSGGGPRQNAVTQAERKAAQGSAPAYLYWFQWQTPVLDGRPRAYHCSELPFVFYNTDRCAAMTGGGPGPRELAGKIADAWINFAKSGDPNHAGLPDWPSFNAADCPTMIFDNQTVLKNNPDTAERKAIAG